MAFVVTIASELAGALLGGISGFFGGWVDSAIQRVVDFLDDSAATLAPGVLVTPAWHRHSRRPAQYTSVVVITIILIAFGWMGTCRLVRGMVLTLRALDFSEAARALGMSNGRIIIRHMIPNAMAPIIVSATLGLGGVIVLESALSFLGFGVQPPVPTWGNMLRRHKQACWGSRPRSSTPGWPFS